MEKTIGVLVLLVSCVSLLFGSDEPGADWMEYLDYRENEVYPIKLQINFIPLVKIKVNSSPLWVIFDTGCSEGFSLTTAVEAQIEHKIKGTTTERWLDGSYRGESKIVMITSMQVFGDEYACVETSLSDWRIFSTFKYNGLLGLGYFKDKRVTINYKTKKNGITERPLVYASLKKRSVRIAFLLDPPCSQKDLIYVLGKTNGQTAVVFLDTGSSASFIDPDFLGDREVFQGKRGPMARKALVSIGGFEFRVPEMRVLEQERGVRFAYPVAVKIGSDVLKEFLLTVDKITNRIILQSN